jgi:hypothetical protein
LATSRLKQLLDELKASPQDVRRLQDVATEYQREGNPSAAAGYLVIAAELWALDGMLLKAIALAKKATDLAPGHVEALKHLVEWHEQLGLFPEAQAWREKLPAG